MLSCFKPAYKDEHSEEERKKDAAIRGQLKRYKAVEDAEIKLLLLGAGESGKSTIFKQVKIIHKNGYGEEECRRYKSVVHQNIMQCVQSLIKASQTLNIPIENEKAVEIANEFQALPFGDEEITPERGRKIATLWSDKGIKATYARRSEFQLLDSCEYFMNEIERISKESYTPTQQDVLRTRVKTVGIIEDKFTIDNINFRIVDVGGQRNERRKWIHAFDNVTAIIFVLAISEYDQKLYEDEKMNRMKESLLLFNEICNNRYFRNTSVILFFNKKDLFEEKIKHTDLNVCFPEYTGGCNYEKAINFIRQKFEKENKNENRTMYSYVTCATDTKNIEIVLNTTKNILLNNALADEHFI